MGKVIYMKKNSKNTKANDYGLTAKDLKFYNYLSIALGCASIFLTPTGVFGIVTGIVGLCASVTYCNVTKKTISEGLILCIIGSLLSALFTTYILILYYN